ncbi:hypothetical protein J6590_006661 [Homalodisca vitripennis]|nr:hypothetical protein J6590_006661 [Homalodisca vitripennis]
MVVYRYSHVQRYVERLIDGDSPSEKVSMTVKTTVGCRDRWCTDTLTFRDTGGASLREFLLVKGCDAEAELEAATRSFPNTHIAGDPVEDSGSGSSLSSPGVLLSTCPGPGQGCVCSSVPLAYICCFLTGAHTHVFHVQNSSAGGPGCGVETMCDTLTCEPPSVKRQKMTTVFRQGTGPLVCLSGEFVSGRVLDKQIRSSGRKFYSSTGNTV